LEYSGGGTRHTVIVCTTLLGGGGGGEAFSSFSPLLFVAVVVDASIIGAFDTNPLLE
jgi:hypothetical protein